MVDTVQGHTETSAAICEICRCLSYLTSLEDDSDYKLEKHI